MTQPIETLTDLQQIAFRRGTATAAKYSHSGADLLLRAAFDRARHSRVAVVGIGDSNQFFGGAGWSFYLAKRLYEKYNCWGTGVHFLGRAFSAGEYKVGASRQNLGSVTGAPANLDQYDPAGEVKPYVYLASGESITADSNNLAMNIAGDHPISTGDELQFRSTYGTFDSGTSTHTPIVRLGESPWTTLATGSQVTTNQGAVARIDYSVTLPSGAADRPLTYMTNAFNQPVNGPFWAQYLSAENPSKTSGITWQTLLGSPGASLADISNLLDGFTATGLQEYFRVLSQGLTSSLKSCVVLISSGLNDRNESLASTGPAAVADGDSPQAFVDNLDAIRAKLITAWTANGLDSDLLHIGVMVSHPVSDPDDAELISYRHAVEEWAVGKNCSLIDLTNICHPSELSTNSWYDAGGNAHLKSDGYDSIARRVAKSIS